MARHAKKIIIIIKIDSQETRESNMIREIKGGWTKQIKKQNKDINEPT